MCGARCSATFIVIEHGWSYLPAFRACFPSSYISIVQIHFAVKTQKVSNGLLQTLINNLCSS